MQPYERIICALDVSDEVRATSLVRMLAGRVGVFKVGLELAASAGPGIFDALHRAGAERIFYDAKLHDIPNTVAGAMRAIAKRGVWAVTLHAAGGSAMLCAALEAACSGESQRPLLLAVTLLTSISPDVLRAELRVERPPRDYAANLAALAQRAGCDGVIASPLEIEAVRAAIRTPDFLVVAPGVRPAGAAAADQARIAAPADAIRAGADYLVVGRPITEAEDPAAAAEQIAREIEAAEPAAKRCG